ncbi:hypothetical protein DFP73DRAFT_530117 [Morchella snyderi]|nr:hypothetical protein DFP73DRAFT_530117 [Morchella snyderi]
MNSELEELHIERVRRVQILLSGSENLHAGMDGWALPRACTYCPCVYIQDDLFTLGRRWGGALRVLLPATATSSPRVPTRCYPALLGKYTCIYLQQQPAATLCATEIGPLESQDGHSRIPAQDRRCLRFDWFCTYCRYTVLGSSCGRGVPDRRWISETPCWGSLCQGEGVGAVLLGGGGTSEVRPGEGISGRVPVMVDSSAGSERLHLSSRPLFADDRPTIICLTSTSQTNTRFTLLINHARQLHVSRASPPAHIPVPGVRLGVGSLPLDTNRRAQRMSGAAAITITTKTLDKLGCGNVCIGKWVNRWKPFLNLMHGISCRRRRRPIFALQEKVPWPIESAYRPYARVTNPRPKLYNVLLQAQRHGAAGCGSS